jgi:hypothetical protein
MRVPLERESYVALTVCKKQHIVSVEESAIWSKNFAVLNLEFVQMGKGL